MSTISLGSRLETLIAREGLTRKALALRADVRARDLDAWIAGAGSPTLAELGRLAEVLRTTPEDLAAASAGRILPRGPQPLPSRSPAAPDLAPVLEALVRIEGRLGSNDGHGHATGDASSSAQAGRASTRLGTVADMGRVTAAIEANTALMAANTERITKVVELIADGIGRDAANWRAIEPVIRRLRSLGWAAARRGYAEGVRLARVGDQPRASAPPDNPLDAALAAVERRYVAAGLVRGREPRPWPRTVRTAMGDEDEAGAV